MFRTTLIAATMLATPALAEIETTQSLKAVPDAMDALVAAVEEAGATVFARVDHAQGAADVDMQLRPAQLLIFGNPALGTPAMQDDIHAGLVLPLRVLIYQDDDGDTQIAYEEVEEMFDDLDVDEDAEYLDKMENALRMLTDTAAD